MNLQESSLQCQYGLPHQLSPPYKFNSATKESTCPYCCTKFDLYSDYLLHLNSCSPKWRESNGKFLKTLDVDLKVSNDGIFSCSICPYSSYHKQNVQKHLMTHTGEKPFACNMCSYRATHKHHLDNHIKTHTGEKPFSCSLCSYKGSQKHHLDVHMKKHTIQNITNL